jgi:hypothetical protein
VAQSVATTQVVDLAATVTNITAGVARVTKVIAMNTSAATAFVQVFDCAEVNVTLGTTVPKYQIVLAATTGFVDLDFGFADSFLIRMSAASTTTSGGSTGSAAGVRVQAWVD